VVLAELSEELDGEYTWEEMTERFNERTGKEVSTSTVFRFCKSRGWRERGASLGDAQGVLPCSLPHSLPR
jgi:predicted Zn-dependent protease with MMP-like domain